MSPIMCVVEIVNEVLDSMRTLIKKTLEQGDEKGKTNDGMDITLLDIDKAKNKVKFASAGHRLFLYRDRKCFDYKGDSYPVGAYFGKEQQYFKKRTTYNTFKFKICGILSRQQQRSLIPTGMVGVVATTKTNAESTAVLSR